MSRYPFEEYSERFLESMVGVYSDATLTKYRRRYRRMARDLRRLHDDGKISTTSPKSMDAEDVRVHLQFRRSLELSKSEYSHEVTALVVLFDFCENMAVRTCLRKYPLLRPTARHQRLPSLEPEVYDCIAARMNEVAQLDDVSSYALVRSYAMLAVFLGCGARTKELRLMSATDLNTDEWLLDIVHVKGEDTYGEPRCVPVPPSFRAILRTYLSMRPYHNPDASPALFPPSRGSNLYLAGNSIRKILSLACEDLGIEFDPRKLRRSFGQHYLDSGIDSIESVSVLMGHASTKTTELYYARRRNSRAIEEARKTFNGVIDDSTICSESTPLNGGSDGSPDCEEMENGAGNGVRTHDLRISLEEVYMTRTL